MRSETAYLKYTHHRGWRPSRPHFERRSVPMNRLRGVPAVLPADHPGVNPQRLGPAALAFSSAASFVAPPAAVPLLLGALGFQLGFGVGESLRQGWHARAQKRALLREMAASKTLAPTRPEAAAVARLQAENRVRAYTSLYPSGYLAAGANVIAGTGTLLKAPLLGGTSVAASLASTALLHVAIPLVSLFAATSAIYGVYYIAFSAQKQLYVTRAWDRPCRSSEKLTYQLLVDRLRAERLHAGLSTLSYIGVAVGAPLTLALGPVGLSVLLPGVLGSAVTSYTWANKVAYVPQLSPDERLRLNCSHKLIREVVRSHGYYGALKEIKSGLRYFYPFGLASPVGHVVQLMGTLRRHLQREKAALMPSAKDTVQRCWQARLHADTAFEEERLACGKYKLLRALAVHNDDAAVRAQAHVSQATTALSVIQHTQQRIAQKTGLARSPNAEFTTLVRNIRRDGRFSLFAEFLANDHVIFSFLKDKAFHRDDKKNRWSLNSATLTAAFSAKSQAAQHKILTRAYVHARTLYLTHNKQDAKYRERELLDLLALNLFYAGRTSR